MFIKAPHPTISEPSTYTTVPSAAAATSLTVANVTGFAANDYVVTGTLGDEGTTIDKISSTSGSTTLNFASDAVDFAHSVNTPVTFIKYNQVKFYLGDWSARYSTGTITVTKNSAVVTGSGTSWGSITTSYALLINGKWYDINSVDSTTQITLTTPFQEDGNSAQNYALVPFSSQATAGITADQPYTQWDDTDALAEDYYRTEYYNSTTTLASTRSDIISASVDSGFSEFSLQAITDEVLSEMRDFKAERRSRDEVKRDVNNALRNLTSAVASKVHEDYLSAYTTMNFVANVSEYRLPDDFKKMTRVQVSYDGTNYYIGNKVRIGDDDPNVTYPQTSGFYYLRDNVIGFRPVPTTAVTAGVKLWYERRFPSLDSEGDELPYFFKDYKRLVVDYALEKANLGEDEVGKASQYRASFEAGKKMLVMELTQRDGSRNQRVEMVNDQYDYW